MIQNKIKKIVIITAMQAEALPIVNKLGLIEKNDPTIKPFKIFSKQDDQHECVLITNGICPKYEVDRVCTQPAALTTWEAIRLFSPDLIINAGTAGGFLRNGANVNDVYISDDTIDYHDRRIPLPGFKEYGIGNFPCLSTNKIANDLNLKKGKISTGNSLDMCVADEELINLNQAQVKDMEAAAIAEVAWLKDTPMIAIKSITDLIDSTAKTEEEFINNLESAVKILAEKMQQITGYIFDKTVTEL